MEREQITKKDLVNLATKKDMSALKKDISVLKDDLKRFATKDDLDNLELNIQKDFQHMSEIYATQEDMNKGFDKVMKAISNLPDKHYLDEKIGELRGEFTVKHKQIVRSSKHIASVVGRHHNKTKGDIKDILVAKEALNSI